MNYTGVPSLFYKNTEKKFKILGGKNGKLKCKCGKLRYKGVDLCPDCYKNKIMYYVCKIDTEEQTGYYESNEIHLLEGIDINNAMYRSGIKDINYDSEHYILRIPKDVKEFTTKKEAELYIKSIKEGK
jgi:hypothetical protein